MKTVFIKKLTLQHVELNKEFLLHSKMPQTEIRGQI